MPTYPYDPSGTATTNRIANESRFIQPPAVITDASFVIVEGAPFFKDSLEVWTGPNRTGTRLQEGEHFNLCFEAVALELAIGKILYGGFYLIDRSYTGTIYIFYQALGGSHTVASATALEALHRKLNRVVYFTWDLIVGAPTEFTPAYHLHTSEQDTMQQVIEKLNGIIAALPNRQIVVPPPPPPPPPVDAGATSITIEADTFDLNLRQLYTQIHGQSASPVDVDFIIAPNVLVTSTSTSTPAVITGNWPEGSSLRYINNGITAGRGGNGGSAVDQNTATALRKGGDGGVGIQATYPLLVVNNNILAGGRGGGPALPSSYFMIPGNPIQFYLPSLGGGGGAPFGTPGVTGPVTPGPNIQPYPFTRGGPPQSGGRLIGGNGGSFAAGTSLFGLPQRGNGSDQFITANAGPGGRLDGAVIQFQTGYNLIGGGSPGYTWQRRPGEALFLYRDPDGNVIWYFNRTNGGVGAVGANGAAFTGPVTVTGNPVLA